MPNTDSATPRHLPGSGPTAGPGSDTPQPRQLPPSGASPASGVGAALPMALMMWVVGPILAHHVDGPQALTRTVVGALTVALVWQFVFVMVLVPVREYLTICGGRPSARSLWLLPPRSPWTRTCGWSPVARHHPADPRRGPRGVHPSAPASRRPRNFGVIMRSDGFQHFMRGSWLWFAVLVTMFVFNTVLGEELLFRGYLLPRMHGVFGERDWIANGLIFAVYHLHRFWGIPGILFDMLFVVYPTKRYRSAWIGIAVHSFQSVIFTMAALALVLTVAPGTVENGPGTFQPSLTPWSPEHGVDRGRSDPCQQVEGDEPCNEALSGPRERDRLHPLEHTSVWGSLAVGLVRKSTTRSSTHGSLPVRGSPVIVGNTTSVAAGPNACAVITARREDDTGSMPDARTSVGTRPGVGSVPRGAAGSRLARWQARVRQQEIGGRAP